MWFGVLAEPSHALISVIKVAAWHATVSSRWNRLLVASASPSSPFVAIVVVVVTTMVIMIAVASQQRRPKKQVSEFWFKRYQ
jgi:hypothetical protein